MSNFVEDFASFDEAFLNGDVVLHTRSEDVEKAFIEYVESRGYSEIKSEGWMYVNNRAFVPEYLLPYQVKES